MKTTLLAKTLPGLLSAICCAAWTAQASVVSPVQSAADPLSLPVAGLVQKAGSDSNSAAFQSSLSAIKALVNSKLPEYKSEAAVASSMAVKFSDLYLSTDSSVRIYFVSEGASYRSSLGLNLLTGLSSLPTASTAAITSSAEWIFPDASSNDPTTYNPSGNSVRSASAPLTAGDFVDLGTVNAGTLLDFFLVSNAVNGGKTTFTAETSRNSDALQHIVTFTSGNYLMVSFEDTNSGGDKDYNDVVFAVEINAVNTAPEPGTWAALTLLCGLVGYGHLRKHTHAAA